MSSAPINCRLNSNNKRNTHVVKGGGIVSASAAQCRTNTKMKGLLAMVWQANPCTWRIDVMLNRCCKY